MSIFRFRMIWKVRLIIYSLVTAQRWRLRRHPAACTHTGRQCRQQVPKEVDDRLVFLGALLVLQLVWISREIVELLFRSVFIGGELGIDVVLRSDGQKIRLLELDGVAPVLNKKRRAPWRAGVLYDGG